MLLPFILVCIIDNEKKADEPLGNWAEIKGKVFNWVHKQNSNINPERTGILGSEDKPLLLVELCQDHSIRAQPAAAGDPAFLRIFATPTGY